MNKDIKGINVCNPVDVDKEYLLYTVEYAHDNGFNHIQINGPIHNYVKGNIDGMTPYKKYAEFNGDKDSDYVSLCLDAVNEACDKADSYGIKVYMWHHELEMPPEFKNRYPEIVNSYGDIEVTHPLVRDFLENKLKDFFDCYPKMSGIILTLHETQIPLLKLKEQKLSPVERVKYVTKILFDTCRALGKELIVRPFASIEDDYVMMAKAYEEISEDLIVMDKWTQFDWSLTMPSNRFFSKIQHNPLAVEADIYGEFFGRGFLPLMLYDHLKEKFSYCEGYSPVGYVFRIDRAGGHPFGDINEVNLAITKAYLNGLNVDDEIDKFFADRYPDAAKELKELMKKTEDIIIKTIYLNGYYFNQQSFFPDLNHSKNHYYFEILRQNCDMDSNEWFVPRNYDRGSIEKLLQDKEEAETGAMELFNRFEALKDRVSPEDYKALYDKFANLMYGAQIWNILTRLILCYTKYFDTRDDSCIGDFEAYTEIMTQKRDEAVKALGDDFFCLKKATLNDDSAAFDYIGEFIGEIKDSFYKEKAAIEAAESEELIDYVICGGAMEGHRLQKEVNFSDTLIKEHGLCRLAGSSKGAEWCAINAHGWFSYLIKVVPNSKNIIKISADALGANPEMKVTIGGEEHILTREENGVSEYELIYTEAHGDDSVRIRFDKISNATPCVYTIKVCR